MLINTENKKQRAEAVILIALIDVNAGQSWLLAH